MAIRLEKTAWYLDVKDLQFIAFQVDPKIDKPKIERVPDSHFEVSQQGDMYRNVKIYCDVGDYYITRITHQTDWNKCNEIDLKTIRIFK